MVNEDIIDQLKILSNYYKDIGDKWRVYAYNKAIVSIRSYNKEILSKEQALTIPSVGKAIADKIGEYLETKRVKKVEMVKKELENVDEKNKVINNFLNIWGVGQVKAKELYEKGFMSISEIRKSGKYLLNKNQLIGLKYYEELLKPISRHRITIFEYVLKILLNKEFGKGTYKLEICGSYRRGKMFSNDIDCLITSDYFDLEDIVKVLKEYNVITEVLSYKLEKFMGIANCPSREENNFRFDIEFVKKDEWYPALLYFTGSKEHNIMIRERAKKLGYKLDQHGLYKGNKKIKLNSEEQLYEILNLEYVPPENR